MIYFIIAITIWFITTLFLFRKNIYSIVPSVSVMIFVEILMFYVSYLNTYIDSNIIMYLATLNELLFFLIFPICSAIILLIFAFAVLEGEKFDKRHIYALIFGIIIILAVIVKITLYFNNYSNVVNLICELIAYFSDFMMIMASAYYLATTRYRRYRNKHTINEYDCIIVLGYRLDGDQTSQVLRDRIDMAFGYFSRHGKCLPIYLCGGKCFANKLPEADVMEKEFLKLGVPQKLIHKESSSSTTKQNFEYIKNKMVQAGVENPRCLIVTNYFHLFRALLTARSANLNAESIGSRKNIFEPLYIKLMSRELMAFIFNNPYLFVIYSETLLLILSFAYITFTI